MDRVAELAAAVGPGADRGRASGRVARRDAAVLGGQRRPARARPLAGDRPQPALDAAKRTIANIDLKTNAMTVGGAVRCRRRATPAALSALKDRLTKHPLFLGTLIDAGGTTTAVVVRLKKTHEHNVIATVAALREAADAFAARHGLARPAVVGPPVLLADGFSAIEVDGRRLAAIGMILIGVVTLSAVRSVWWAIVPMLAGWVIWLATEEILARFGIRLALSGGPLVAQIIVLTMPAASHLAIHFRDDRRREADPRRAARATLASVAAPIAWTAITGAIGYGALVTSAVMPVRQFGAILGTCTLGAAILVMLISPIAMLPPFRLEVPVRYGSRSRVSAAMNRLIFWVHRHPGAIVAVGRRRGAARLGRAGPPQLRDELHQPVPPRDAGSSGTITRSSRGSAGSAWWSWSCRSGASLTPEVLREAEAGRGTDPRDPGVRPAGGRAGALAGDGARPGRAARRPARRSRGPAAGRQARPDRRLAPGRAAPRLLEPRGRRRPASSSG